jgi:hypothetical protein
VTGGGVNSVPRGGRKMGESEGGVRCRQLDRGAGMALSGVVEGGSMRSRQRRASE